MLTPGLRLRALREQLGFTIRDVEAASERIAEKHHSDEYILNISRLSEIETKGVLPTIFRLYSLATIYRVEITELLQLYGISSDEAREDQPLAHPSRTHRVPRLISERAVNVPVKLDPLFDLSRTTNIGRMVQRWGAVPFTLLEQFAGDDFTYGYIGAEDYTMYPILLPGSFVRVDEKKARVVEDTWRSEYERPIYFVETREGYTCCWCTLRGSNLVLQPHPLSPAVPKTMRFPHEAEVIGQVVAIAMVLNQVPIPRLKQQSLLA
jgi:transcriptional regulator with XRE-family HTH domain